MPVIASRKRANTFFTFGFAQLLTIPQSTDIVSLGLTTLSAVDGDHVSGELFITMFDTSVKFLDDGLFVFLIFPARQAEHGVSLACPGLLRFHVVCVAHSRVAVYFVEPVCIYIRSVCAM